MTVFVDDNPVEMEKGFAVRHAILRFSEEAFKSVTKGSLYVADSKGDEIDLDGALFDGMRLYLRKAACRGTDPGRAILP